MMINQTMEKLQAMKLTAMVEEYRRQSELSAMSELSFNERFAMVTDAQWTARQNAKLKRLLKIANLRETSASLADLSYKAERKLDKNQVARLSARSYRTSRLLTDLAIGRGDGSYNKLLAELKKPDMLILDDFGLETLHPTACRDLLEVVDDRYDSKSIAISAQLPISLWYTVFEDATIADAVMDRIVNNSYRFELQGPTMRVKMVPNDMSDDATE